jgi:hypothetical protein
VKRRNESTFVDRATAPIVGNGDRAPTKVELGQMITLLEDGLRAGALGMSSGLFTPPGSFAQPDEMIALCAVLKRHNAASPEGLRSTGLVGAEAPVRKRVADDRSAPSH